MNFGDNGWDSAEYLSDVPLNETLFQQGHLHESLEGDDALVSFNSEDLFSQNYFPQLIEAIESDVDDEYAVTPKSVDPTSATEEASTIISERVESNLVEDEAEEDSSKTPLFLFLTPSTSPAAVNDGTENDLNSSVQSGVLNVEDSASNKDDTVVKYDLLLKLAEKIKSNNWLGLK